MASIRSGRTTVCTYTSAPVDESVESVARDRVAGAHH